MSDMNDLTEKTLNTERKYTGKIISVDLLDIELPDGRKTKREVIRHGNAVAILARRPDGKFVFVKQYRKAAEEALIEVIAGGLEAGEDPIEGAKRETAEETGYDVTSIKFLTTNAYISTSPNFPRRRTDRTRIPTRTSIPSSSPKPRSRTASATGRSSTRRPSPPGPATTSLSKPTAPSAARPSWSWRVWRASTASSPMRACRPLLRPRTPCPCRAWR